MGSPIRASTRNIMKIVKKVLTNNYVFVVLTITLIKVVVSSEEFSTLASVLVGAYITWFVALYYFEIASQELNAIASRIMQKQENPEQVHHIPKDGGGMATTIEMSANLTWHEKDN